jgi:hypothetical protein
MESENKSSKNLNTIDKWATIIFFLSIIPPVGVYYIWIDMQYFQKRLPAIMLLYGGLYLFFAYISLTQWLPSLQSLNIVCGSYTRLIFVLVILFSIINIVLAFIINAKFKSLQDLPQSYKNLEIVSLSILLVIFPIILFWVAFTIQSGVYQKILQ